MQGEEIVTFFLLDYQQIRDIQNLADRFIATHPEGAAVQECRQGGPTDLLRSVAAWEALSKIVDPNILRRHELMEESANVSERFADGLVAGPREVIEKLTEAMSEKLTDCIDPLGLKRHIRNQQLRQKLEYIEGRTLERLSNQDILEHRQHNYEAPTDLHEEN